MSRCGALLAFLVFVPTLPAAGAQREPDACGPRLLRADEPAALLYRLHAIGDRGRRVGYRTPYLEWADCDPERTQFAFDARSGLGLRRGERLVTAGSPRLTEDRTGVAIDVRAWLALSGAAEVAVQVESLEGDARLRELSLLLVGGPFYGWLGRRAVGYGTGSGGGIVLSGQVPLDGVGLGLRAPGRLPGSMASLGTWDFELVVGRAGDNGEIGRPWFAAGRWVWAPSPTFGLGLSRGVMFGGAGAPGMTARRFIALLIAGQLREKGKPVQFNNHIVSLDVVARSTLGGLPVLAFFELGMEDAAGAWKESPALVMGIEVAHPSRGFRLGIEWTSLFRENGHGFWYRHSLYQAGWSDRGRLLGHPLGGPGTEWLLHFTVNDPNGRWDLNAALRARDRIEGNSLGPDLEGQSFGGVVNGRIHTGEVDLVLRLDAERVRHAIGVVSASAGVRWTRGGIR